MIDTATLRKAWDLLSSQERRRAAKLMIIVIISALASAVMVGSVFPFLSLLADPSLIETSAPLAWLYDVGGFRSDYQFLMAVGVATSVVILVMNVILFLNLWALTHVTQMQVFSLSRRLLSHFLAQPYEYFLNRHSGNMATSILGEANEVVAQYMRPLLGLISAVFTIFAIVSMLLILNPAVTLAAIVTFGLIYVLIARVTRRSVRNMGELRASANRLRYRLAGEALTGIKDIKLLGREAAYLDRYSKPTRDMARYQLWVTMISNTPQFLLQVVAFSGIVLLSLLLVDPSSLRDRAALGELLPLLGVLAFAGQRLLPQLHAVYGSLTQMTYGKAALGRVHTELFDGQQIALERSDPSPMPLGKSLALQGVRYFYPNAEVPGIDGIDLSIRAGERIGIVGSSGAGKTTLADIVLGLLEPQAGAVLVDGEAITPDTLRSWQKSVGYVPQDIFLTDASLSENIALGVEFTEIDQAKVENCAQIAQLHDFILNEMPDGYKTKIGERGVRLSGGQRQRIGIARALYNDADLIVFDEATSALDNLTEREVMAAINSLPGDKTILMIAHRLTTVKVCDRIVVMENGSVSGVGTWHQLVDSNETFKKISEVA